MDRDRLEAERALVEAARRGDQEARENLLEPMVSMLRRHIERRLDGGIRRKVSSSDVIQEIRITVYGKISDFEYRGPRSLDRWVWSIADTKLREATRRYVDPERRRAAREVSRGLRPDTQQIAGRAPSPIDHAVASELRERVQGALALLRPDYREVLRLYAETERMEEVAKTMKRSYEATKRLHSRALAALEKMVLRI